MLHVAGPRAFELTRAVFRPRGGALEANAGRLHYGHIVEDGEVVDEVLVRLVPGEPPLAEINCHGGVVAVQRVIECLVRRGAEAADAEVPMERGARSPLAAEAARALMHAATPLGVETLLDQLNGALEQALERLPRDDAPALARALRELLATERLGRALWQPPAVALVGPTNAGKSTLFNALAREDRMIVSPTPGTTRDAVSAEVALGGLPVRLTDTAGEREPGSAIEAEAIARSRRAAAAADLVLLVLDGSCELPAPWVQLEERLPPTRLLILNKMDLGLAPWARALAGAVRASALRGDGLEELCARVVEGLVGEARYEPARAVVFTERQARLVRGAIEATERGALDAARTLIRRLVQGGGGEERTITDCTDFTDKARGKDAPG